MIDNAFERRLSSLLAPYRESVFLTVCPCLSCLTNETGNNVSSALRCCSHYHYVNLFISINAPGAVAAGIQY